jgi:hypothetical protein
MPRAASDDWPVMAVRWSFVTGPSGDPINKYLMLAYDDRYSIMWFGTPFPPYWNRNLSPDAGTPHRPIYTSEVPLCVCVCVCVSRTWRG